MKFSALTTVATVLAASTSVSALPVSESPSMMARSALEARATTCTNASVDKLLFSASIGTFENARKAKNPSKCNWSSDGCSWSPDKPDGYNFIPSCHRHDFGYRNTKSQKRFTKAMKKKIDDNFKKDLYKYCSQFSGWSSWKGVECRRLADIYVAFVRKYGKRDEIADVSFTKRENNIFDIELDEEAEVSKREVDEDFEEVEEFDGAEISERDVDEDFEEVEEDEDVEESDDSEISKRDVDEDVVEDEEVEEFDESEITERDVDEDFEEVEEDEDFDGSEISKRDIDEEVEEDQELDDSELAARDVDEEVEEHEEVEEFDESENSARDVDEVEEDEEVEDFDDSEISKRDIDEVEEDEEVEEFDEAAIAERDENTVLNITTDEDIEGQDIPDVLPEDADGDDVEDLDAYLSEDKE